MNSRTIRKKGNRNTRKHAIGSTLLLILLSCLSFGCSTDREPSADSLARYVPERLGKHRIIKRTPSRNQRIFNEAASGFGVENWVEDLLIADIGRDIEYGRNGLIIVATTKTKDEKRSQQIAFFGTTPGEVKDVSSHSHAGYTFHTSTVENAFGSFHTATWQLAEKITLVVTIGTHAKGVGVSAAETMEEIINWEIQEERVPPSPL